MVFFADGWYIDGTLVVLSSAIDPCRIVRLVIVFSACRKMDKCEPGTPNPQREKLLAEIETKAKTLYNLRRSSDMPTWNQLLTDAKEGFERVLVAKSTGMQSGGAPSRKQVAAMIILFLLVVIVSIGVSVYQGIQQPPALMNQVMGEGCNDIAYDAYLRIMGVPLYPGCALYHRGRNDLLALLTGQRQALVADNTLTITGIINTMVGIVCAGGTLATAYARLMGAITGSEEENGQGGPGGPSPPQSPPPGYKKDFGDGGDDGAGLGGIAAGGKRRRTRRTHKKTNKTRRRKSHSKRRHHSRK